MAIKQSTAAKGQAATPSAYSAGIVTTAIYHYDFTEAFTAASDKLELGTLLADTQIVGATVIGLGLGDITADVGLMSGTPGSTDNARTVGDDLFDAADVDDAEADATLSDCLAVARSNAHRSIGAVLSGNVAAGANKRLTLRIDYIA